MSSMSSNIDNPSVTPDALRDLSEEQTERLTAALDDYLARLEAGETPDLQGLLAKNSDIQESLKLYIGKLGDLHNFAAGFSPHLAGTDDEKMTNRVQAIASNPSPIANRSLTTIRTTRTMVSTLPPVFLPSQPQARQPPALELKPTTRRSACPLAS